MFWADPSGADARKLIEELFNRSSDGENWTNNHDGTYTSDKGQSANCNDCKKRPDFQFEEGKEEYIKENYPKFYNLIKNQMKNVTVDKNIIEAFSFWSGYSITEIEGMLQYDSGAIIRIYRVFMGVGEFDPSLYTDGVGLDMDYIKMFEKNYIPGDTSIRNLALIFHATMSVLHEVTHKGEWEHGVPKIPGFDRGTAMQAQIYGNGMSKNIGPENEYDPKLLQYVKDNKATLLKIFGQ